jgi:hypothetical protein
MSLPKHLVEEDTPELEKMRSCLVAMVFDQFQKSRGKLLDVSVTAFSVLALPEKANASPGARSAHTAVVSHRPPPPTWPLLSLLFASRSAAESFMKYEPHRIWGRATQPPARRQSAMRTCRQGRMRSGCGLVHLDVHRGMRRHDSRSDVQTVQSGKGQWSGATSARRTKS